MGVGVGSEPAPDNRPRSCRLEYRRAALPAARVTAATALVPMRPEPVPMGRLLRAVPADRHAAPASGAPSRVVGKEKRADRALAGFHDREVSVADELSQRFPDREQKGLGCPPPSNRPKLKRPARTASLGNDP